MVSQTHKVKIILSVLALALFLATVRFIWLKTLADTGYSQADYRTTRPNGAVIPDQTNP